MDPITVVCKCGHSMRFSADKAGRKARCAQCTSIVQIEAPKAASSPSAKAAPAASEPSPADIGAYGVVFEEPKPVGPIEGEGKPKKKKLPKIQKKFKRLPDADAWVRVREGMQILVYALACLGVAHFLNGVYVLLGSTDLSTYAEHISLEMAERAPGIPAPGYTWQTNDFNICLGLISGRSYLGFAKFCMIAASFVLLGQYVMGGLAYTFYLPVPAMLGANVQARALLGLTIANALIHFFLRLLPVVGAYNLLVIPLLFPEMAITEYNMERSMPIMMLYSTAPFLEHVVALVVRFMGAFELTLGCVFLYNCGRMLKDRRMEEGGLGLVQLSMGVFLAQLAFYLISICGATPILVLVLRVLYAGWYIGTAFVIARYAMFLMECRQILELKIDPPFGDEDEDEDRD